MEEVTVDQVWVKVTDLELELELAHPVRKVLKRNRPCGFWSSSQSAAYFYLL